MLDEKARALAEIIKAHEALLTVRAIALPAEIKVHVYQALEFVALTRTCLSLALQAQRRARGPLSEPDDGPSRRPGDQGGETGTSPGDLPES